MTVETRPIAPLYRNTQYSRNADSSGTLAQTGQLEPSATITSNGTTPVPGVLPGQGAQSGNESCQIQIANTTDKWCFVNFGQAGNVRAAAQTDYPVAPGAVQVVTVASEVSGVSIVLQAAAGSLTGVIFTRGSGT